MLTLFDEPQTLVKKRLEALKKRLQVSTHSQSQQEV